MLRPRNWLLCTISVALCRFGLAALANSASPMLVHNKLDVGPVGLSIGSLVGPRQKPTSGRDLPRRHIAVPILCASPRTSWLGRFCDQTDTSGQRWVDLCWVHVSPSVMLPGERSWGVARAHGLKLDPIVHPHLFDHNLLARDRIPIFAGASTTAGHKCPSDARCLQVLDVHSDAHVLCTTWAPESSRSRKVRHLVMYADTVYYRLKPGQFIDDYLAVYEGSPAAELPDPPTTSSDSAASVNGLAAVQHQSGAASSSRSSV